MKIVGIIFLLLYVSFGYGQSDSLKQRIVLKEDFSAHFSDSLAFIPLDSTLDQFYYYEKDGRDLKVSLGNSGYTFDLMSFDFNSFGFHSGESLLGAYYDKYQANSIYKTNTPFARISYINGAQSLQDFDLFFTENVGSYLNFALRVGNYQSDGFYLNQDLTAKNFDIQGSYFGERKKYSAFLKYNVRSGVISENGGIKGDSIYSSVINDGKLGVQVWMENSSSHYDKRTITFNQSYRFGSTNDSGDVNLNKGASIGINTNAYVNDLWYEDLLTDSSFYDKFGLIVSDSSFTNDMSRITGVKNQLYFNYKFNQRPTKLSFGIAGNGFRVENIGSDSLIYESSIGINLSEVAFGAFSFDFGGKYGLTGFNVDGYEFNGRVLGMLVSDQIKFSLSGSVVSSMPTYKEVNYSSPVVQWSNQFEHVSQQRAELVLISKKFGLEFSAELYNVRNYTFYRSSDASPDQFKDQFGGSKYSLTKKFTLKAYHFDVKLVHQRVDNKAPVNLPDWLLVVSFYYQRFLFDKALEVRYGLDYWQNSNYYANDYLPFSRSFAYQNQYSVGDYPYLNFYVSARIKGAQGFINFQNIGQIFLDKAYMMTPYYPMRDFGMSFGIRWDFYN